MMSSRTHCESQDSGCNWLMVEKSKYPSDDADRFQIRMPNGMRDEVARRAKAAGRSMNAEVIHRLKETLDRDNEAEEFAKVESDLYPAPYGQVTLEEMERQSAELRGDNGLSKFDEQELSKRGPDDVIAAVVRLTEAKTEAVLTKNLRKLIAEAIEDVLNRREPRKP